MVLLGRVFTYIAYKSSSISKLFKMTAEHRRELVQIVERAAAAEVERLLPRDDGREPVDVRRTKEKQESNDFEEYRWHIKQHPNIDKHMANCKSCKDFELRERRTLSPMQLKVITADNELFRFFTYITISCSNMIMSQHLALNDANSHFILHEAETLCPIIMALQKSVIEDNSLSGLTRAAKLARVNYSSAMGSYHNLYNMQYYIC